MLLGGRFPSRVVGLGSEDFHKNEPEGGCPYHEVLRDLMWLANQTTVDLTSQTAARAVAGYCHAPKMAH